MKQGDTSLALEAEMQDAAFQTIAVQQLGSPHNLKLAISAEFGGARHLSPNLKL